MDLRLEADGVESLRDVVSRGNRGLNFGLLERPRSHLRLFLRSDELLHVGPNLIQIGGLCVRARERESLCMYPCARVRACVCIVIS